MKSPCASTASVSCAVYTIAATPAPTQLSGWFNSEVRQAAGGGSRCILLEASTLGARALYHFPDCQSYLRAIWASS